MPTLTKAATKLQKYLKILKITGAKYLQLNAFNPKRKASFIATLANLAAFELTPTVLTVGVTTNTTIALSWTAVTNATNYVVTRSTNKYFKKDATQILSSSAISMTASGLTANTTYYFKVTASATTYGSTSTIGTKRTLP